MGNKNCEAVRLLAPGLFLLELVVAVLERDQLRVVAEPPHEPVLAPRDVPREERAVDDRLDPHVVARPDERHRLVASAEPEVLELVADRVVSIEIARRADDVVAPRGVVDPVAYEPRWDLDVVDDREDVGALRREALDALVDALPVARVAAQPRVVDDAALVPSELKRKG